MPDTTPALVAALPDHPSREGVFSTFEPGTRTLPAGLQVKPGLLPIPIDILLDKDVAVCRDYRW